MICIPYQLVRCFVDSKMGIKKERKSGDNI